METNFYECIIILKEFSEEFYKELQRKSFIFGIQKWGMKKLAYPIGEYQEGYYILLAMYGTKNIVDNFDKELAENDSELKHVIIRQDNGDVWGKDISLGKFDYLDKRKVVGTEIKTEPTAVAFEDSLIEILNDYTNYDWENEPLDGDEVDHLVEHIRNQLNLINDNITQEEYLKMEEQKAKNKVYVLSQYVYGQLHYECDNEVLGVYDNLEKAIKVAQKNINEDLNKDFVLDEELESDNIFRLFYEEQENWDCYLEYIIKEMEIQ